MKKLSIRQMAAVKRTAMNVNPLVVKKNKALMKAKELLEEAQQIDNEIKGYETGTIALTGGYTSEQLVTKVVETTDKQDKDGNPVKVTKYIPTSIVSFNEEDNCYYINEPTVPPTTENVQGSDFDADLNPQL